MVSYFLNNDDKTCLYWLKISDNIEIGHVFQFKAFFHLTSNLHTSCFSVFNSKAMPFFNHLWSLRGFPGLDILNCVLKCMLVLFLCYYVEQTKHWEQLIYYLFQTFPSLLRMKENFCFSARTGLWRDGSVLFSVYLFWFIHGLVQPLFHTANSFFQYCLDYLLLLHFWAI